MPDLDNFTHQEVGERAEVPGTISKLGRVPDEILRPVAGICHTPTIWKRLGDGIKCCHADASRQVHLCLLTYFHLDAYSEQNRVNRTLNVNHVRTDTKRFHNPLAILNVDLLATWHQNADNSFPAKGFNA